MSPIEEKILNHVDKDDLNEQLGEGWEIIKANSYASLIGQIYGQWIHDELIYQQIAYYL